jgi:hypothetical protein
MWEGEMTGVSGMMVTFWWGEGAVIAAPMDEMKRRRAGLCVERERAMRLWREAS